MAEDRSTTGTAKGGEPQTVVSFGRTRSGATPVVSAATPDAWDPTPAASAAATPWGVITGVVLTLAWVGVCAAWAVWPGHAAVDLLTVPPLQLAGIVAVLATPLAMLWLLVALFDRNASMRRETAALRQHLALLAYPADSAEARITTIADSLRAQARDLSAATREAAAQGQELRQMLAREIVDVSRLSEEARTGVADAMTRIGDRSNHLHTLMSDVGRLAREADETLGRRAETLDSAADKAKHSAEGLGSVLDRHTRTLGDLATTLEERTRAVESLAGRQETAAETLRTTTGAMASAAETLSSRADTVSDSVAGRAAYLVEAEHRLAETATRLSTELRTSLDLLTNLGLEAERRSGSLEERSRRLADAARTASQDIDAATAAVSGDFTTFREGARDALEGARAVITAIREGNTQAETLRRTLSAGVVDLKDAGDSLHQQSEAAGSALADSQSAIAHTTERAAERLRHMQELLGRNAVEVTRTTARATVEIETVSEALKRGLGSVQAITQEARDASATAGADSEQAIRRMQAAAAELLGAVEQLHGMGSALTGESERVTAAAAAAITGVSTLTDHLRQEGESFGTLTAAALTNAERLRDTFNGAVRQIDDTATQAAQRLQLASEVFEHTTDHASTSLADTSETMEVRISTLRQAAEQAASALVALTGDVDEQSAGVAKTGVRTIEMIRKVMAEMGKQAEHLNAAAKLAEEKAKELDLARDKADVQRFLTKTSYAFEKLQAAAVDLSRLFTPTVEEELWKRFYKGEQNVFLRHAAKTITRSQAGAVRKLYQSNPEFRDYATRYIGEFESLMKATRSSDRAEVLSAVFTSSDMGRLYMVLARSLNRDAGEQTAAP